MNKTSPFLLLILGLLAGFPAARLATAPAAKPETPPKTAPAAQPETPKVEPPAVTDQASLDSQDCKPEAPKGPGAATATATSGTAAATATAAPPAPLHPWCMPVRLLRDFLGLPFAAEKTRSESLREVLETGKARDYDLRFMIALVPALPDPRMDQALDAIQRGFARSVSHKPGGFPPTPDYFLLDRVWLPWASAATGAKAPPPTAPGLLLFRGDAPKVLALVFVVPETSKLGIQKEAFREALDLIADLQTGALDPRIEILGPSFSGSVESLRMALLSWRDDLRKGSAQPPKEGAESRPETAKATQEETPGNALVFHVATGSASAENLEAVFDNLDGFQMDFCRTVLPDSVLQTLTFDFLSRKMGWDLSRVGLLVEDDTQYGQSFVRRRQPDPQDPPDSGPALIQKPVLFTFPSHLADLRNAWEDLQKEEKKAETESNPVQPTRRTLGLDLSGDEREADLVPHFSSSTTASDDLLFSNLLETIAREGIRYVGIVATDPKDKLFLAEKLRQLAPDIVLFTYDNNLLYAHPDQTEEMSGMLVLSSYPLYTEGAPGFPSLRAGSGSGGRRSGNSQRRQFGSEYQEGVYQATRYLLGASSLPGPQAWIAAVGNGSLWPIAQLPVGAKALREASFCGQPRWTKENEARKAAAVPFVLGRDGFDDKDDLQLLLVAVLFCLLAVFISRAALLEKLPDAPLDPDDQRPIHDPHGNRALLALGIVLLIAGVGTLLAVASLPLWSEGRLVVGALVQHRAQWVYLLILAAAYGWLVWRLARAVGRERLDLKGTLAWGAGGLAAFVLLAGAVFWLGVPDDQAQLFYLRARAFSSGLSPLVPLAILGAAIYVWIWSELTRRRLLVRLASDCPLESLCDPALMGSGPLLRSLRALMNRTLPRRAEPHEVPWWVLPALVFIPAVFLLGSSVQPVAEPRPCGRLFVLFVLAAYALSALSFYRFVRLWRATLRILHRLDNSSPVVGEAFQAIAKELDWRPIKSFGWQIPPFRSLILSVQKLRELAAAGKVDLTEYVEGQPDALEQALDGAFANEREEGSVEEIVNRNILERILSRACGKLRDDVDDPEVRKFLALRVAAYLRFVFAHLRSCLIGALSCGLLALLGVAVYAFEPKHLVSLAGWLGLALEVALTLWIFFQMDRNATLTWIGGGDNPGEVTFDRAFLTKLLTYAGIPVLGLIATQFPEVARLLGRVVGQFLRVVGGG